LLDHRSRHIEQGSIPTMGGRNAYIIFGHVHQTSTDRFNREPTTNTSAKRIHVDKSLANDADVAKVHYQPPRPARAQAGGQPDIS
jgi:hypothetical protein